MPIAALALTELEEDLLGAVVVLAEALTAAQNELEEIAHTEIPLPDKTVRDLEERQALVATMRRVTKEDAAVRLVAATSPQAARSVVKAVFREERGRAYAGEPSVRMPVHDYVERELVEAFEFLRRRALLRAPLRDAILSSNTVTMAVL